MMKVRMFKPYLLMLALLSLIGSAASAGTLTGVSIGAQSPTWLSTTATYTVTATRTGNGGDSFAITTSGLPFGISAAPVSVNFSGNASSSTATLTLTATGTPTPQGSAVPFTITATQTSPAVTKTATGSVKFDTVAPTTMAQIVSGTLGTNSYYRSAVGVKLTATDAASGATNPSYKLDNGTTTAVANGGTVGINTDGNHVLEYWDVDVAGNIETHQFLAVKVDATLPVINSVVPANLSVVGGTIALSANITESNPDKVEFFVNGSLAGTDTDGSNGWSVTYDTTSLTSGSNYNYTVTITDLAGNTRSASVTLKADNIAPTVNLSSPADNTKVSGTAALAATASDANLSKVDFYVDSVLRGSGTNSSGTWTYNYDTTALADGDHIWYAVAIDLAGNSATTGTRTLKTDNVQPAVSLNTPADNALVTGSITLTATASGNNKVEFYVDGALVGTDTDSTGGWTYALDTSNLSDGSHTWLARSYDAEGNIATTTTRSFSVDNTAPTVNATSPASGAVVKGTITLTATAADANIDKVEFAVDGVVKGNGTNNAGTYTFSFNTTGLSQNSHTWSAKAYDLVGKTTTSSSSFIVDTTLPVFTSLTPANNSFVRGTITLTATVTDANMSQVDFRVTGVSRGIDTDGSDGWSITLDTTTLTAGNNSYTAIATDKAGNAATATAQTLKVDNIAPSLSLSSPADNAYTGNPTVLTVNSSDSNPLRVDFYVDSALVGNDTTPSSNVWSYSLDTSGYTDGDHTWYAIAYDAAGNNTTSATRTMKVDNIAPTISLASPADNALVSDSVTLIAAATGSDRVEIYVDGGLKTTDTDGSDGWTYSLDTTGLSDGSHTWYARAIDAAGNVASATTRSLRMDNTAPTVNTTSPASGAVVKGTITLTATAADANIDKVEFAVDGVVKGNGTNNAGTWTYAFDTTGLGQGSHTWSAKAYDLVGKTATSSSSFVFDSVAPVFTSLTPANNSFVRGTITLTATVTDANMSQVDFRVTGVSRGIDTDGSDGWSISLNTTTLPAGNNTYTAVATDKAGNSGTAASQTLKVDNTAPGISLTSPAAGAFSNGPTTLTASATDASGISEVRFLVDGTQVGVGTNTSGSSWSYSYDSSVLTEGDHNWSATAVDAAGNTTTTATRIIKIDKTFPAGVQLQTPADNSFTSSTVQLKIRNSLVELNLLRVDFYVDGILIGSDASASRYQYDLNTTTLSDGPHIWYAVAVDKAGNSTQSDTTRTMKVDNTAPDVALAAPVDSIFASGSVGLSATASDLYLDRVEFYVDGVLQGTGTNNAGTFTYSLNTTGIADGPHTWSAKAYDLSGKFATTSTRTLKVDNNAPVVTATSPADNSAASGIITLSATASDAYLDRVDFYIDTMLVGTGTNNAGTWSIQLDTTTLTDGIHPWSARGFDQLGRSTTSSLNIDVFNNDAPTLDAIADPAPVVKNSGQQTVNLTGITAGAPNESGQTLTVTATSSDTSIIPDPTVSVVNNDGTATLAFTTVTDALGTVTVTVTVDDGYANNNTFTRTFTVRVILPNQAPVAVEDTSNVNEDASITVDAPGVLGNDTDAENSTLTAILVSGTGNGSLTFNGNGSFSYTPNANYNGTDSFTYKANDGVLDGNTVTVTINVASINDGPTIGTIADATTAQETATSAIPFTVSDVETAADDLTYTVASTNSTLASGSNIAFGGSGTNRTITVTPATGKFGTATLTVTVHDADGGAAASSFVLTVTPRPIIAGFNPAGGAGVGMTVNISGSFLSNTTAVTFNNIPATFTQVTGTLVNAIVPSGLVTGKIRLTTAGGTGVSATDFTLIQTPQVGSFSPIEGAYGTPVTISGLNLANVSRVEFNGFATTGITQVNSSQIKVNVPNGATTGKIKVFTPGGQSTSTADFTVYPPPVIGSFSPNVGNIGTQVNISGSHLGSTQLVKFNTQHTLDFTVLNNNSVQVRVPAGATTGKITIQTKGGTVVSTATFTVILAPRIASFTPASGGPGTLVTLSGNNLTGVAIAFNGVPAASVTPVSSFQVRAVVPVGATTGRITATNLSTGEVGTSGTDFIVLQGPTITSLSTLSGQVGTGVVISGSNFTGAGSVKFNGVAATFVIDNANQITATVPSGATTGKVSVTTPNGTGVSTDTFTVDPGTAAPVITSFSPTSGATGTTVFVYGTGFAGATGIQFNGLTGGWTVLSPMKAQATVPLNATTGKISITTAGGTGLSSTDFTVTREPVIFSFTPGEGPAGTTVTINGANFSGATSVKFNGATAGFSIISGTQIRATVPNSATTGKISITNGQGTGQSSTDFKVTPRVDSFTPTSGPVGTVVTINGRAFGGTTAVQFNGELAEFTVVSATQIQATVPEGATTGVITVTTPSGVSDSAASFTVTP